MTFLFFISARCFLEYFPKSSVVGFGQWGIRPNMVIPMVIATDVCHKIHERSFCSDLPTEPHVWPRSTVNQCDQGIADDRWIRWSDFVANPSVHKMLDFLGGVGGENYPWARIPCLSSYGDVHEAQTKRRDDRVEREVKRVKRRIIIPLIQMEHAGTAKERSVRK